MVPYEPNGVGPISYGGATITNSMSMGSIALLIYFVAVGYVYYLMIRKDFFDNDWVSIMGHLLCDNRIYHICSAEVGLGALAMISLYVFAAIILAIVIYMAIVSYYI